MDGPNANRSFLEKLTSNHHDEFHMNILFLGSCSLRVIDGAFKTGHATVKWKVQLLLRSFPKIFKVSPVRRADYTDWTGRELSLKKFCSVRRVENIDVCLRALAVLRNVKKYM